MSVYIFTAYVAFCILIGSSFGILPVDYDSSTQADEFPCHVLISLLGNSQYCGGTIIDGTHIVSSAFCFFDRMSYPINTSEVHVFIDQHDGSYQVYNVSKIGIHEEFNIFKYHDHPITMLTLTRSIVFNSVVKPAKLPTLEARDKLKVKVSNFKTIDFINRSPIYSIRTLKQKIISTERCHLYYPWYFHNNPPIKQQQLCTRGNITSDFCKPVMGSGLFDGETIIGITIYNGKCHEGTPDIYMRVFSYLNWIEIVRHLK